MGDFIPFIIFVVIFFRILGWLSRISKSGKKGGKKKSNSVFDEIKRQMEEMQRAYEEQNNPQPLPEPIVEESKTINKKIRLLDSTRAQSAEITEAPYSNLEEGILDEVHKSKFSHHARIINKGEIGAMEAKKKVNYLKNFDPKTAFIHSIIFDRKHFDVGELQS